MKYNIFFKKDSEYKDQQVLLWKNNLKNISDNRYKWFYEENPYAGPVTVLAETEQKSIVGSCSLYIRDIVCNNSKKRIGIASDFAVNEEHRVFGPALKMQRLLVEEGLKQDFNFLFAFPNNNSRALFERVGYEKLGAIHSGIKILKSRTWVNRKFKNKLLSSIISFFIDSVFYFYDHLLKLLYGWGYNICTGFSAENDYDALWEDAKKSYPIIGEKTASYLKWRYVDNPSKSFEFLNAYNNSGRLKGFIVYTIDNQQATLEELFVASGDEKTVDSLLAEFITLMRKQNIEQIRFDYLGKAKMLQRFKKVLFFIQPGDRYCLILHPMKHENERDFLFNINNWFLFESEMDI